jgi:hypothetical protein
MMKAMRHNEQPTHTWDDHDTKALLWELTRHHSSDPLRRAVNLAILCRIEQLERLVDAAKVTPALDSARSRLYHGD